MLFYQKREFRQFLTPCEIRKSVAFFLFLFVPKVKSEIHEQFTDVAVAHNQFYQTLQYIGSLYQDVAWDCYQYVCDQGQLKSLLKIKIQMQLNDLSLLSPIEVALFISNFVCG